MGERLRGSWKHRGGVEGAAGRQNGSDDDDDDDGETLIRRGRETEEQHLPSAVWGGRPQQSQNEAGTSSRANLDSCSQGKYAQAQMIADRKAVGISKGTYLRVHFKNTRYAGPLERRTGRLLTLVGDPAARPQLLSTTSSSPRRSRTLRMCRRTSSACLSVATTAPSAVPPRRSTLVSSRVAGPSSRYVRPWGALLQLS